MWYLKLAIRFYHEPFQPVFSIYSSNRSTCFLNISDGLEPSGKNYLTTEASWSQQYHGFPQTMKTRPFAPCSLVALSSATTSLYASQRNCELATVASSRLNSFWPRPIRSFPRLQAFLFHFFSYLKGKYWTTSTSFETTAWFTFAWPVHKLNNCWTTP